jgi:hypothetical protein
VFSVRNLKTSKPLTRNPQPENQRVKKKNKKEFKKDLERRKRVLLLHPQWKRRSE